jgi:hypothetical protein
MMNSFFAKFVKVCPKSGRVRKIILPKGLYKLFFPIVGLAAIIWILIRVIPKPSRLSYPCVKTAIPLASGFIGYLAILVLSTVAFFRSKKPLRYYPVFFLGAFLVCSISGFVLFENGFLYKEVALTADAKVNANEPIGIAQGMQGKEGRVVWIHNPNAVNQKFVPDTEHAWWMAENNNQSSIDSMVSAAIQSLTDQRSDSDAWQAIFQYHNGKRGKGAVNYKAGEKIFIKINECSGWGGNFNSNDLSKVKGNWYNMSETSPAVMLSVLHQLVDIVHVAQSDIYIGDPIRNIYKEWYNQLYPKYPNIHYLGIGNYENLGREKAVPSASAAAKIYYSDRGSILRSNTMPIYYDSLYTIFENAEYLINLPQLKGHMRAGITMFAKNHFGSQTRGDAMQLHKGLPCPEEMEKDTSRLGYGLYRVQVDLMTQSLLREKNLIFLLDGLWGTSFEQNFPVKWQMAPFNDTYSSSVFASLDNVAIESVGYDLLRSEFTIARCASLPPNVYTSGSNTHGRLAFPQMRGADDYLHQAADSTTWPVGVKYDPDNSGVHIFSLGVHEHWNNATDMQYTRNLGSGNGIELVKILNLTDVQEKKEIPTAFQLSQNYPNPFNPATSIEYSLPKSQRVTIKVYDIAGKAVALLEDRERPAGTYRVQFDASKLTSGVYFYKLVAGNYSETKKMLLLK